MKKRFLALLLVLTMVFSLMPAALAADTLSGSGTEDDPYLLATAADLKAFRDMANAEASSKLCATLTADIDLGGKHGHHLNHRPAMCHRHMPAPLTARTTLSRACR